MIYFLVVAAVKLFFTLETLPNTKVTATKYNDLAYAFDNHIVPLYQDTYTTDEITMEVDLFTNSFYAALDELCFLNTSMNANHSQCVVQYKIINISNLNNLALSTTMDVKYTRLYKDMQHAFKSVYDQHSNFIHSILFSKESFPCDSTYNQYIRQHLETLFYSMTSTDYLLQQLYSFINNYLDSIKTSCIQCNTTPLLAYKCFSIYGIKASTSIQSQLSQYFIDDPFNNNMKIIQIHPQNSINLPFPYLSPLPNSRYNSYEYFYNTFIAQSTNLINDRQLIYFTHNMATVHM